MDDLSDEILIKVFECLQISDIKACRLVNHKWHQCCARDAITNKEKFVFRAGLLSPNEMNTFMAFLFTECKRTSIAVEFTDMLLEGLDFQSFGESISTLELKGRCVCAIETLMNLFYYMPNIHIFHCTVLYIINPTNLCKLPFSDNVTDFCEIDEQYRNAAESVVNVEILRTIFNILLMKNFVNKNLVKFQFFNLIDSYCTTTLLIQQLPLLFPSLHCISLEHLSDPDTYSLFYNIPHQLPQFSDYDGEIVNIIQMQMASIELGSSISELSKCLINFNNITHRSLDANSFVPKLPKMKILHVLVCIDDECQFFNSCLKFFSHQTELEELSVEIFYPLSCDSSTFHHKQLFFHILNSCRKLERLSYWGRSQTLYFRNHSDIIEFVEYIDATNLKELNIDCIEMATFTVPNEVTNYITKGITNLKKLISSLFFVTRYVSLEKNSLKYLELIDTKIEKIDDQTASICVTRLVDILKNQMNLHTLILHNLEETEPFLFTCPNVIQHSKLQSLKIESEDCALVENLINFLCLCEFENLRVVKLLIPNFYNNKQSERLTAWLGNMHFLEYLELPDVFLSFEKYLVICSGKNRLRELHCCFMEKIEDKKIVELFTVCPTLQLLCLWYPPALKSLPDKYYYCKFKQQLFRKKYEEPLFKLVCTEMSAADLGL